MLKLCPALAAIFDFQLALKHIYFVNNHHRIVHNKLNFKPIVFQQYRFKAQGIKLHYWL